MNCLESRRRLLISPRELTHEQRSHMQQCESCSRLKTDLDTLETDLEDAVFVPVPDALADRVLLAQRGRRFWHFAAAAFLVLAVGASLATWTFSDFAPFNQRIAAVGPAHPAVAAISLVADDRLELPKSGDDAAMAEELKRLGLAVKRDAYVYYAGKCRLSESECDLIIVSTRDAYANVVLVPNSTVRNRMVVEDRDMTAVINPAGPGAYIVVARNPAAAKRIDRLIVKERA